MAAWELKHQEVDDARGMHIMHLVNRVTGAEHKLQINLLSGKCAHCGRTNPPLSEINPADWLRSELAALEARHELLQKYKKKHRLS